MPHGATISRFMTTVHDLMTFAFICLIVAWNTRGLQAVHTFRFYANYKIENKVLTGFFLDVIALDHAVTSMVGALLLRHLEFSEKCNFSFIEIDHMLAISLNTLRMRKSESICHEVKHPPIYLQSPLLTFVYWFYRQF